MLVPKRASCLGQLLGVRIRVKSLLPRAHNTGVQYPHRHVAHIGTNIYIIPHTVFP